MDDGTKALLFDNSAAFEKVIAPSPAAVKAIGRQIIAFKDDVWNVRKYNIVVEGNLHKFSQKPMLADFLAQTGKRIIVEASLLMLFGVLVWHKTISIFTMY